MKLFTCLVIASIIIQCLCQQQPVPSSQVSFWHKIFAIGGVILIIIAALIYFRMNQGRYTNITEIFRQYIMTPQAEVTFVNFKSQNDPRVQEVIQSSNSIDKSGSLDQDYSKDQQLSIDQGNQSENRNLSSVFDQKQGKKSKKSKSRKRLANNARISSNLNEQQNVQIAPSQQL